MMPARSLGGSAVCALRRFFRATTPIFPYVAGVVNERMISTCL
jgi:hypothetical protein